MNKVQTIQEQHTAGAQSIGFDYQFYYFMFLALDLKMGQKIGFEVKDDIHIDKEDETTILFQAKHSILKSSSGTIKNLTTLDSDLWKTLNNWADMIKANKKNKNFLRTHSFILVTNKNENNNEFINLIIQYRTDNNIDDVVEKLKELESKTEDETLTKYIKNVRSTGKTGLKQFLQKLTIETGVDHIIEKIKNRLIELYKDPRIAEAIFDSLYSNLQATKYLDIKDSNKFEISFDDFSKKFGRCFKVATETKPLPRRSFPILLPEDLESQVFIKQLLDIGEVQSGSEDIRKYTTLMLKFLRHFTYWSDEENFILLTEAEEFKQESISKWANKFKSKYRQIESKIDSGSDIVEFEVDIKNLAIELVEYIREQDLTIPGYSPLGIDFSNGHYYALSDNLEIGWHLDWRNKYKKE